MTSIPEDQESGLSKSQRLVTSAVVATLRQMRFLDDTGILDASADDVEGWANTYNSTEPLANACCPLCEEVACDEGCALTELRKELDAISSPETISEGDKS